MTEEKMSLAVFSPIKATLAEVEKRDSALVFDHTTPDGETELRSWVYRIRRHRSDLEKVRAAAKDEALSYGKKVDTLAKELKAPYDKMITKRMEPLDEIEAKKRADAEARVAAKHLEEERIEQERLDAIAKQEAEIAEKQAAIKAEENKLIREREILEAEKLAEADAKRREQAAKETAEREASNRAKVAEQEKAEALAKAEREKQEAIEAEQKKARKLEVDRQAKIEADKVEKAAEAEKVAKKAANLKHRRKIEDEIQDGIWKVFDRIRPRTTGETSNVDLAKAVLEAIVINEIPNVKINY